MSLFETPDYPPSTDTAVSRWQRRLGLTRGNPFAVWITILLALSGIALVILLGLVFFGPSTQVKYTAGIIFMFVGALAPIPLTLLIIYSRNYARIQNLVAADHWAHWTYTDTERHLWPRDLLSKGREVFIGPQGVHWPARRFTLQDFNRGLTAVEIQPGQPAMLKFQYAHKRYGRYTSYTTIKEELIPIPSGKEAEAETIIEKFKPGFGRASGYFIDQWVIGFIMGGIILLAVIVSIVLVLPLEYARMDEKNANYAATRSAVEATETIVLSHDLTAVRPVIERHLQEWQAFGERYVRSIDPLAAGFKPGDNVKEIITGYCPDDSFFVFVLQTIPSKDPFLGDTGAFAYSTGETRYTCAPPLWEVTMVDFIGDGWYYVSLSTYRATMAPKLTEIATLYSQMLTGTPEPNTSR